MKLTPALLPRLIEAIADVIEKNAEEVTALDQAIGDGDHVTNLQRGIQVLMAQREELSRLDWAAAWQKIGMTLMSAIGGASGSLYGTLFIALSKAAREQSLDLQSFADVLPKAWRRLSNGARRMQGKKPCSMFIFLWRITCERQRRIPLHYLKSWPISRRLPSRVWSLPAIWWLPRVALLFLRSAAVVILMRAPKPVN